MKKKVFNCHRNKKIVINRTSIESSTTSVMCNKNTYSCMSLYKRWPLINFYTYKKIREIVIALLKRNLISAWPPCGNLISTWPPMKKFCETPGFHDFFGKNHKINRNLWQFHNFFEKKNVKTMWDAQFAYI